MHKLAWLFSGTMLKCHMITDETPLKSELNSLPYPMKHLQELLQHVNNNTWLLWNE